MSRLQLLLSQSFCIVLITSFLSSQPGQSQDYIGVLNSGSHCPYGVASSKPIDFTGGFRFFNDGYYLLENIKPESSPPGLAIFVGNNNVGHLQSVCVFSPEHPTSIAERKGNIFVDWKRRTSCVKHGIGWVQLSLEDATDLWGQPKNKREFYTFDAHSHSQGEPNIFHLDLKFNKDNVISAYRIRGIGIENAQWITPEWKP
jgi:hypothetical protein